MYADKKRFYDRFRIYMRDEGPEHVLMPDTELQQTHACKQLDKSLLDDRMFEAFSVASSDNYLFLCNMSTNVSRWSKSAIEYFDMPDEYMYDAGSIWLSLLHPDDREMYAQNIEDLFNGNTVRHDMEYRVRNKSGQYVICTCHGVVLRGKDDEANLFAGMITNHGVVDGIDPITNLRNNREFLNEIRVLQHSGAHAIIMMVELDMFSNVNMIYGHAVGDTVLRYFGERMRELLGGRGMLFRLDGAAFGVCAVDMSKEEATSLYRDIQQMAWRGIPVGNVRVTLRTMGGAFLLKEPDGNQNTISSSTAHALAQSRRRQGQLVFFHNQMLNSDARECQQRTAIHQSAMSDCNGFFLCYQPIVHAENGDIIGMEALVRWKDADGVVPPDRFIPWLEEDSSIVHLGNWIIRQSLADAMRVRELMPDFSLNINVAAAQFERPEFRDSMIDALRETGFPPSQLCLELTGNCWNLEPDLLRQEIAFFRSHGIQIAIDDFGTANAALGMLTDLSADIMKVDKSVVAQLVTHERSHALVGALTQCAQELGMRVCMEGVENQQVLDQLKTYAVGYYQGYYYSRPVEIEEFITLLRQAERGKA